MNLVNPYVYSNNLIDVDALLYINNASITRQESKDSINYFIVNAKSNNLWSKIYAIYPFFGTTASQHKFNAKNPIDTDAAFRLVFSFDSDSNHSELGYQTNNGSFANTKFTPSLSQSLNSNGMTVVIGTDNTPPSSDTIEMGSYNSGPQESALLIKRNSAGQVAVTLNGALLTDNSLNNAKGIWIGTKQSSTVTKLFRNGGVRISGNSSGTLPTVPVFIGALNLNGNRYGLSNQRIQMAIIHEGLSDAEVGLLNSIIDASETIAGRKTW